MKKSEYTLPGPRLQIRTERLAYGGYGVGRWQGLAVLIEGALPDEDVEVELIARHARYARARVVGLLNPSPHRVQPLCPVFGRCGGCHLLHASYPLQVAAKTQFVRDAFRSRPDLAARVEETTSAPEPFRFRNRLTYSIAEGPEGLVVGFHARNDPHTVISAETCVLCPEWHHSLLRRTTETLRAFGHALTHQRYRLDVREGRRTGQRMAVLSPEPSAAMLEALSRAYAPLVDTLVVATITPHGEVSRCRTVFGRGFIEERLGSWTFEIPPMAFFQTYTEQAENLFRTAAALAAEVKPRKLVELYAGVGAWTAFLSEVTPNIHAAEISSAAVAAARRNLQRHGLTHIRFSRADAASWRPKREESPPDLVALDPPRAGLNPAARAAVLEWNAPTILYVSCDPMTLARDVMFFESHGYQLDTVRPFDLFPHTYHVECVARLRRRGGNRWGLPFQ